MLREFSIHHRRKPHLFANADSRTWTTCLRSLRFAPVESMESHDEFYCGTDAYRFLLEVICGLHSPVIGETEVFGQFKEFTHAWLKYDPRWTALVQRTLSDAKILRTNHLSGLGHQSYGSWIRKNLISKHVHILGAGNLAREILPYVVKRSEQVTLHVRDEKRAAFHTKVQNLNAMAFDQGALIVAAPMGAAAIRQWLNGKCPVEVFDLRDSSKTDKLNLSDKTHGLHDIFTQIERNKIQLRPLIEQVKHKIFLLSQEASHQVLIRPQGWDDLCA